MVDSKQQWKAWLYLSPAIVLLLIFTVWPIFNTFIMAFLEGYNPLLLGATFKPGFGNFTDVLVDDTFLTCLTNTMILTFFTVIPSTLLALLIAVALNSIKFLQKGLQTIFFLPYVTNSIAIGMVFAAMFNIIGYANGEADSWGVVNNIIMMFGGEPIKWISQGSATSFDQASVANYAVVIIYIIWNALPFKILILLGGLQSVNKQYYDAARVDGTPRWRVLTRITVPLLSPMIAYVVITGFIGGFKEYSSVVGIYGDKLMGAVGAKGTMNTMVGYIYDILDKGNPDYGKASAAALILFAIILVVTMINMQVSKKRVHY